MFWTPAQSGTSTIMNAAKLTRFSWWRLTSEVNLLVGRPFPVYHLSMHISLLTHAYKISIMYKTA